MKTLKKAAVPFAVAAALAIAAPPAAQGAETLVPPENSAVTQYTEAFPTAGGPKDVHDSKNGRRSPKQVLGGRNAARLDRHGSDGDAVAELVVDTAPAEASPAGAPAARTDTAGGGGKGGGGGGQEAPPRSSDRAPAAGAVAQDVSTVDGSSGLGSVLEQALGTSSEGIGVLLLLILLGTAAWAVAYGMRQRRRAG